MGDECEIYYQDAYYTYHRHRNWGGFRQKVAEYSESQDLFAWKYPSVIKQLKKLDGLFVKKKYIFDQN